nr:MAG TPA_asm: hypothetical protein [Caudoviricetes sp.]
MQVLQSACIFYLFDHLYDFVLVIQFTQPPYSLAQIVIYETIISNPVRYVK